MATETSTVEGRSRRSRRPRSHLFTVRVWTEDVAGGSEYRGNVRDVTSGAFCSFQDWSDLAAFMITRMADDERAPMGEVEGGRG